GLLVKSTVIMKENLEELKSRGMESRWPVMLGGAALTRAFVEDHLREMYTGGEVHYAKDAFEGLALMDKLMHSRRTGAPGVAAEEQAKIDQRRDRRARHARGKAESGPSLDADSVRADVATDIA